MMIGWFQYQHGDGTADLWTIDNVNITLSLDRGASGGSDSGSSSSSGTPVWIFGIIAAVVIIVIVALIIGAVVFLRKRSSKEQYEFATAIDHSVFENPVFGEIEDSTTTLQESSKEYND